MISGCATLYEKPDPVVGQWEFELPGTPQGDLEGTLTIHKEDGVYSGFLTYSGTESDLNDLTIEGNHLVSGNYDYQGYLIELTAVFEGEAVTGEHSAEGGMALNFEGVRVE